MPRFSTKTVNAMLIKATGIKGYVPQGLKTAINRTKISSNFGPKRVKDVLGGKSNPNIDQNTLNKIFEKIDETGALKTPWAESKEKFTREVAKQQRIEDRQQKIDKQIEQKNQQNTKSNTSKAALGSQKIQANKQPETVKPEDKKASNIAASRVENERAKRGREIMFGKDAIGKLGQVMKDEDINRRKWKESAELGVKSRGGGGMATEGRSGGLVGHAVEEEKKDEKSSPKGSKGGQKSGGSAPAGQKSGGHQPVKLQGSVVDRLTRQPVARDENLPGVFSPVKGLDKAPASQPEISPAPRSASASEDISDMDI